MDWKIEFTPGAAKQLSKLDRQDAKRITNYLRDNVTKNPRKIGKSLKGSHREFWRYRIGAYRVLARIEDDKLIVLVVRIDPPKVSSV